MSQDSATALGDTLKIAPWLSTPLHCSRGKSFTTSVLPALIRFAAMPLPMPPVPMKPNVFILPPVTESAAFNYSIHQAYSRRPEHQNHGFTVSSRRMHRLRVEKNHVAFFVYTGFVGDLALEHEIELAADVLVLQKSIGRCVGGDPVKHQLVLALTSEPRHFEPVAEIAPLQPVQRVVVQIDL